ncbi:MAG: alanine--tRNA ligase [Ruminococcaceae bacterium]|nr:alanine--tRNA ligase [Oscillospiraceae bacterium]
MQYLGLNELREKFLTFFEGKEHLRLPSFPLLPQGDQSLLLINSGMAPLKPYFSGELTPPRKRVTTCQKCIRTPDIERVGKTSRHGTFFEMLGNFSFGDYFKKEAMTWAWEFITKELEIPVNRLYVSVYLEDDEAWDLWTKEIGVPEDRMVRLGKADNFWEIGMGPCGPCSEIYFDRGEENGCDDPNCAPGCDCDRYVEFWNLVFTQFHNDGEGNYTPLKQRNIDTGMGLERIACIMQGVNSLFDVDTVRNITAHISKIAGVEYGDSENGDVSLRIITDHIRSTTMLICDGVMPSNEGRGYVLRRLLRRAARHGRLLGIKDAFLHDVCATVIRESGSAYPELVQKQEFIQKVVRMEEENFNRTIDAGLHILDEMIGKMKAEDKTVLSGEDAFKLNDTFGFPIDLTLEILEEQGLSVDRDGYDAYMNQQRERARAARAAMGDFAWESMDLGLDKDVKTEFLGYDKTECEGKILALVADGELSDAASADMAVRIVLDQTVFYAESGGQMADFGTLVVGEDVGVVEISDVQKTRDGKFLHIGKVVSGMVSVGDTVKAAVGTARREAIMRAHSSTHLLQKALREVLGTHVEQAGSLVGPDSVRFDFTHFAALTPEEISAVERKVNEKMMAGLPIIVESLPIEEAKKRGAMALFGEKYGNIVRVVQMGDYSIELCGGIHLDNTAKAGLFKIISESSVAAGVRRIEAICGTAVLDVIEENNRTMYQLAELLKTSPKELANKAAGIANEVKTLRQELAKMQDKLAQNNAKDLLGNAKDVAGLHVVTAKFDGVKADALRTIGDQLRDADASIVVVLASVTDGKIVFVSGCGKDAVARGVQAGKLVREVATVAGGSGGGKPDSAMAGGSDVSKLDEALAVVEGFVSANAK